MPRRYYNYLDQFQPLHVFSTVGSLGSGAGLPHHGGLPVGVAAEAGATRRRIPGARSTLEWQTVLAAARAQLRARPHVTHGPYDYSTGDRARGGAGMSTVARPHEPIPPASFHDAGAAGRRRQDRHVAVPGHRNPAVRRPVRGLRDHAVADTPRRSCEAHHHLDRMLGLINTVVLLTSSYTMVMAVRSARKNRRKRADRLSCSLTSAAAPASFWASSTSSIRTSSTKGLLPGQLLLATRATRCPASSCSSASIS